MYTYSALDLIDNKDRKFFVQNKIRDKTNPK